MPDDLPDPFHGDPSDPAAALPPDDDAEPLTAEEREDITADLADLEAFKALLEPRGVLGLVVECEDCGEPHFYGWDLLQGNLRHLLEHGQTRVHEPAFGPDPSRYVTWDYARGFTDAVLEADEAEDAPPGA